MRVDEMNTRKYNTLLTFQMYGIGKTKLGSQFKGKINSMEKAERQRLFEEYSCDKNTSFEEVDSIITTHTYIQIDLRDYKKLIRGS